MDNDEWKEMDAVLLISICRMKLLTVIDFKIPEKVWKCKLIDYLILKIFGCHAYGYVQSAEQSKFDPKSIKCIFLSFEIYGVVTK
jgi:hypothetical protein